MENKKNKIILAIQIITGVVFLLVTAYIAIMTTDVLLQKQEESLAGLAFIVVVPLSLILWAVPFVGSVVGLIISIIAKKNDTCGIGSVIYFIIFTLLPVIAFFALILVINLLG